MRKTPSLHARASRVFYRPIEAAIRWSGLLRYERVILQSLGDRNIPAQDEFPQWSLLRFNTERILDGIVNGDLPYGRNGVTCQDSTVIDGAELTVRHVDLKAWMAHYYPDQKPDFLFDVVERKLHSAITIDAVQALLAEQDIIRRQLAERASAYERLYREHESLRKRAATITPSDDSLAPRSETTYLNIVGGLLTLLLGNAPSGKPYSSFRTMESVIGALLAHYEGHPGIAERTLWAKLAAAKRQIDASTR